jgi:exonuclease-1
MSLTVTDDYINGFIKANNTFLHQLVFDPLSRKLVPLNDYDDDIEPNDLAYAGSYP